MSDFKTGDKIVLARELDPDWVYKLEVGNTYTFARDFSIGDTDIVLEGYPNYYFPSSHFELIADDLGAKIKALETALADVRRFEGVTVDCTITQRVEQTRPL